MKLSNFLMVTLFSFLLISCAVNGRKCMSDFGDTQKGFECVMSVCSRETCFDLAGKYYIGDGVKKKPHQSV